jgi:hypothetical protein
MKDQVAGGVLTATAGYAGCRCIDVSTLALTSNWRVRPIDWVLQGTQHHKQVKEGVWEIAQE